jgi:hypothetical protein
MKIRFLTCLVSIVLSLIVTLWFAHPIQAQLPAPSPLITPSVTPLPSPSATPGVIGRTDNSLSAVITSTNGRMIAPGSCRGVASRVGLDPNQIVTITLQFPLNRIGEPVALEPLDGGVTIAPSTQTLSAAGILQFQFQANRTPGLTQVRVRLGADDFGLQFYVFDSEHPENNPRIPSLAAAGSARAAPLQNQNGENRRNSAASMFRQPIRKDRQ